VHRSASAFFCGGPSFLPSVPRTSAPQGLTQGDACRCLAFVGRLAVRSRPLVRPLLTAGMSLRPVMR